MTDRPPWCDRCDLTNDYVGLVLLATFLFGLLFGGFFGERKARAEFARQEQGVTLERIERRIDEL